MSLFSTPRYWAVVPAAGAGSRMGAAAPKQYLDLLGKSVLEHTLTRLTRHPRIEDVVVVLSEGDTYWPAMQFDIAKPLLTTVGGMERCHSVLNGLVYLEKLARNHDWVLVHDAARPCVRAADIDRLMDELGDAPGGGLLGVPITDTIKRTDGGGTVEETVPRDRLWRALTPQMFRYGVLRGALERALGQGLVVTDEAAAVERAGQRPRIIEGHSDNIKITRPEDLPLAAFYLRQQEALTCA